MSDRSNNHYLLPFLFLGLILVFFGWVFWTVGSQLSDTITINNPRNESFCLQRGFSDWEYASDVTGVRSTIVCIDKGNLEYFIYEDGEYFEVKSK